MPNYYYGEEVQQLIQEQNLAIQQAQQELNALADANEVADPAPELPNWLNGLKKKKPVPEVKIIHGQLKHPDMPWLIINFQMTEGDYEIWKGAIDKFNSLASEPKPKLDWHE